MCTVRPGSGYGDDDDGDKIAIHVQERWCKTSFVYANAQTVYRGRRDMVSRRSISRGYARATASFETVKCGYDCGYS